MDSVADGRGGGRDNYVQKAGRHRGLEIAGHVFYVQTTVASSAPRELRSEVFHSGRVLRVLKTPLAASDLEDPERLESAVVGAQTQAEQFVRDRFAQAAAVPKNGQPARPHSDRQATHLERTESLVARFSRRPSRGGANSPQVELSAVLGVCHGGSVRRIDDGARPCDLGEPEQRELLEIFATLREETSGRALEEPWHLHSAEAWLRLQQRHQRLLVLARAVAEPEEEGTFLRRRLQLDAHYREASSRVEANPDSPRTSGAVVAYVKAAERLLEVAILISVNDEPARRSIRRRMKIQLVGSLELRMAFANFRLALGRHSTIEDMEVRVRYAANDLATLLGSSAQGWLRMSDRTALLDLQYRIRQCLATSGRERELPNLWTNIQATVSSLGGISNREELLARDRELASTLPAVLPSVQTPDFRLRLFQFLGLLSELDRALSDGEEVTVDQYAALCAAVGVAQGDM